MPAHRAVTLVARTVMAVVLTLGAAGTASVALAPAASAVSFTSGACKIDVAVAYGERATCGSLTVPESRAEGSDPAKTIALPVMIVAAENGAPALDRLVVLTAGSPGGGSLESLSTSLDRGGWAQWATDDRDVVFVGQRGDALAKPSLDCPELDTSKFIVDGVLASRGVDADLRHRQVQKCRDRLTAKAIDLASYNSASSAADLATLRNELGYDQWNLYALSSGSRIAMAAMRDQPAGLRSVILDSPTPLDAKLYEATPAGFRGAVDALLNGCATDTECRTRYPDLEKNLTAVLESAADEPLSATVKNPSNRSPTLVQLDDSDLASGLYDALQSADTVRIVPFIIDRLNQGDVDAAISLIQRSVDGADLGAEGLDFSIECAEEAPFNDDALIAANHAADPLAAHLVADPNLRADCATWAVPVRERETQPVASGIPTLILTGGYDPTAPAAFGAATAASLSAARVYDFPTAAQGVLWTAPSEGCAASIATQFLADPAAEPAAACVSVVPATQFLTTADILPTAALYHLTGDIVQERDPVQITMLLIAVGVFIATLIYGIGYGLAWAGRRRGDAPGGTVLAATTMAALYLGYIGGLALVVRTTDPLLLDVGLPAGVWPLLLIPFVALGATILLIVLLVRAWMQREGGLAPRIIMSVSAATSILFITWLIGRGLLIL